MRFFDVNIVIKVPFFIVLIGIEPGRSLLYFITTDCLIYWYQNSAFLGFLSVVCRVTPYLQFINMNYLNKKQFYQK